jgi:hypothetical protein
MGKKKTPSAITASRDMLLQFGFELTSAYIEHRREYTLNPSDVGKVRAGEFMVFDHPPRLGRPTVRRCTGEPGELFAGVALLPEPQNFNVILGCGDLLLYTVIYDPDVAWAPQSNCLVVLGKNGMITRGTYPDDYHAAIGRVICAPTPKQPALGITAHAWG